MGGKHKKYPFGPTQTHLVTLFVADLEYHCTITWEKDDFALLCIPFSRVWMTNFTLSFDFETALLNKCAVVLQHVHVCWTKRVWVKSSKRFGKLQWTGQKRQPPTLSVMSILTDSEGGLQLTPLILYAGSHSPSPSIYLFLFLPHWLTHSCSRSIKLIKGSILSWSPLANRSANQ